MARLPNQKDFVLPSQMHSLSTNDIDRDLENRRKRVRNSLILLLQKKINDPHMFWIHKIPELAEALEDQLYKYAHSQEDYMNMDTATMWKILQGIVKNWPINLLPLTHHTPSSSLSSTTIPMPVMQHNANTSTVIASSADNLTITYGSGVAAQNTQSFLNLLPTLNSAAAVGHNQSFSAPDGSVHNRYQQSPINMDQGSGGNSMISSRQLSQMIPTRGLNSLQQISSISESHHGAGFSCTDYTMISQQQHQLHQQLHHLRRLQQHHQQRQIVGSQNNRILHALGSQILGGPRPTMQQKSSAYRFSNRVTKSGTAMMGNDISMLNVPAESESYLNTTSSASSNTLQQQFDQQRNLPGEGYGTKTAYLSVSDNLLGFASSVVSSTNNQNTNLMSQHSKLKSNSMHLAQNTMMQSLQLSPLVKSGYDHSENKNYHAPRSREHVLQFHHEIQNFQQPPNQSYEQLIRHQHQKHEKYVHQQSCLSKIDHLRQSTIATNFEVRIMPEPGIESRNESQFSQTAEHYHLPGLQSQYQQNTSINNHSQDSELYDRLASPADFQSAFAQGSQQILQETQQPTVSQNDYSSLLGGTQFDALPQSHWHPQPLQNSQMPDKSSSEQQIQEFQQRLTRSEEAQQPRFGGCTSGQASTQNVLASESGNGIACGPSSSKQKTDYHKQTRWLLFLIHARRCSSRKGACKERHCIEAQQLVKHIDSCNSNKCEFPRCTKSKSLIEHFHKCPATDCLVCVPVRDFITSNHKARLLYSSNGSFENQMNNSRRNLSAIGEVSVLTKTGAPSCETFEDLQNTKRMKLQHTYPSLVSNKESTVSVPFVSQPQVSQEAQFQRPDSTYSSKSEVEVPTNSSSEPAKVDLTMLDNMIEQNLQTSSIETNPLNLNYAVGHVKEEIMLVETENDQVKLEDKVETNGLADSVTGSKSGKTKIEGVSLTELFTPEQIREHIRSLRQWVGQSKTKAEKNQIMEMSENSCQLCAMEKLTFKPPPIYCTACGARIKHYAIYYTIRTGDNQHYFCVPCFKKARGETINVDGSVFPKAKLEKKKNDEETEECWVQCDKCKGWQHQICALFNGLRNAGGQAEYTCPNCYIEEIEKGERKPLPHSAVLGAKDLPKTFLSDHIEQRLFRRLKQERQDRARQSEKEFDEVPAAEDLVIRVVSSVDKKLEVKQSILEILPEGSYPTEFPYKSKAVLLFQKIEGVEVCLFCMYVQEFGSECQYPNQRRVNLGYLDSVKYFRPEIRTVTGEALRTFVYHEIMIGYLEYCKKRGFTSFYIWACPPLKGEDYILYCHPDIQKTPKSDKLREWYLAMLRKACKENIAIDIVNLYDHFFTSVGECKSKITAAHLPYFDGDYWPDAAEDIINQLNKKEVGRNMQKRGKSKKTIIKRAACHADPTGNASKDALLMHKLGQTICHMKEDFIMVHLQHACNHCRTLMISGTLWVCNNCKNFQLCDKCFDADRRLKQRERHPINSREKHVFGPIKITDVAPNTKDNDGIMESEFFDTRQAFLSLCQENHYQYDTLRHAKHSSMMVLYHIHNPTAPAFVTTCDNCHHDIETGQGWHCEICPDFDVCNACYQKEGGIDHPHKLTVHPSIAKRDSQNQDARNIRELQLRNMLDLLVHASQCRLPHCQYLNCPKVRALFRHGIHCKTRAIGGCLLCKNMWCLLQQHARACIVLDCCVPRCKELKEHMEKLQQQ